MASSKRILKADRIQSRRGIDAHKSFKSNVEVAVARNGYSMRLFLIVFDSVAEPEPLAITSSFRSPYAHQVKIKLDLYTNINVKSHSFKGTVSRKSWRDEGRV
jgi:hypothetical protein